MPKTSVKFQKNRHKTIGGAAHTSYLLHYEFRRDGRKDRRKDEMPNTMTPSAFLMEKAGDKKKVKDVYIKKTDNMLIILKC